jgi:hypothetical protein
MPENKEKKIISLSFLKRFHETLMRLIVWSKLSISPLVINQNVLDPEKRFNREKKESASQIHKALNKRREDFLRIASPLSILSLHEKNAKTVKYQRTMTPLPTLKGGEVEVGSRKFTGPCLYCGRVRNILVIVPALTFFSAVSAF